MTIKPDREDFDAVHAAHGIPPADADDKKLAHLYRLAQRHKVTRLHEPKEAKARVSPPFDGWTP